MYTYNGGREMVRELYPNFQFEYNYHLTKCQTDGGVSCDMPDAAKVLRLAFHDCIPYPDGTGGCDGCLHWKGVGTRFTNHTKYHYGYPTPTEGDNNGLALTVEVLEEIYTNKNFPQRTPSLPMSLQSSGKSRADLWAFAAIVAVEFTTEENNRYCDSGSNLNAHLDHRNHNDQCHHHIGEKDCKINLPQSLKFQTGRSDCVTNLDRPYKGEVEEDHPNPATNGAGLQDWFKRNFDFGTKETVAIMGGHTLGRFHSQHSNFRYTWTSRGGHLFNNDYYKIMAERDRIYFNDDDCNPLTPADGTIPKTKWSPQMFGWQSDGGPIHWIKKFLSCPNCAVPKDQWRDKGIGDESTVEYDRCCTNTNGGFCRADPKPDTNTNGHPGNLESIGEGPNCEFWRFTIGLDEIAMNAEIGLYFDFNVENGAPTGCNAAFNGFNLENWKQGKNYGVDFEAPTVCPKNMLADPPGSTPTSQLVENYADDQSLFVNDFSDAMVRMLSNKYNSLTDAPYTITPGECIIPYGDSGIFSCVGGEAPVSETLGDVRLSSYPRGRVEIYNGSTWGTLCGHWWWNSNVGADNLCKQMGYETGERFNAPGGVGPIVAGNRQCAGGEKTVYDCTLMGESDTAGCTHDNDQGVHCFAETVPTTGSVRLTSYPKGRVEIYTGTEWGTLCGHWWWNNDLGAANLCRQLGYDTGVKYTAGGGVGAIATGNRQCVGGEATIYDCPLMGESELGGCTHTEDQGVECAFTDNSG